MQNHPRAFRELLTRDEILVMPGVYDGLSALAARRAGFEACSISGAAVSASRLGYPDLGLMTFNEILEQSRAIVRVADLPIIADVDTGFGGPLNVVRTITAFEDIGVAGVHIEDQVFPKKCGHFARKEVIPTEEMVAKVKAVRHAVRNPDFVLVARTDARQPEGLDAAIERSHRYVEAGADIVFLEAPKTRDELERIGREDFGVPLWANLAEGGKTPLLDPPELQELGFKIAVYPGAASKTAARVLVDLMAGIRKYGSVRPFLDGMMSLDERSELLSLAEYEALDDRLSSRAPTGVAE
jgi:2-methylisocitrate lyase-like PEP mutase family enzyme